MKNSTRIYLVTVAVLSLAILIAMFSCEPDAIIDDGEGQGLQKECDSQEYLMMGDEFIVNDDWGAHPEGKTPVTGYRQCVFNDGWEWEWPDPSGSSFIKGYPHILTGSNPWGKTTNNIMLPIQIRDLSQMTVNYSSTTILEPNTQYNLAFDLWVVNDEWLGMKANPDTSNIIAEIMVWEQACGFGQLEDIVEFFIEIDGSLYNLRKTIGNSEGKSWLYLAFVPIVNFQTVNRNVNIHHFINYLVMKNYINDYNYVSNLSFGNEIHAGEGKTLIDNYSVSIMSTTIMSFHDNFNDGDFTNNPAWNLTPGGTGCWDPGTREVVNDEYHFYDMDSPGCGHSTLIDYEMNMNVTEQTMISFDVKPVYSDVRNGAGDTHEEYPCYVQLELYDVNNNLLRLWLCYNYRGGSSHFGDDYIRVAFPEVPQNEWQRDQSFRIRQYFPQAVKLRRIYLGANGWDYEGYFDNIEIRNP